MSDDMHHECGIAALYCLEGCESADCRTNVTAMMPAMLLDLQNRGQLAAGFTTYNPDRAQVIDTFKDVGTVSEAFRMSHPGKHQAILEQYAGHAAIGHTRYATSGADDVRYAQPFERHHGRLWKWFSLAFNGNLANYTELRSRLLSRQGYHFTLNTDTEIIMHTLAYRLRGDRMPGLLQVMRGASRNFDGAYNIVYLDAMGRMFVARDPLGIRPMSWAVENGLFSAANESAALINAGFTDIHSLAPGEMAIIEDGALRFEQFAPARNLSRCFFEWVYFSNVASEIDGAGVYQSRAAAGQRLAGMEDQKIDGDCIVVPVPDTAKAAADAFAYHLRVPCVEGLIRNRYVGRTFIQPNTTRGASARSKYTPLQSVLSGKRVFVVEDSIVRSLTIRTLAEQICERGGAREVHVRVAAPPIVAPCFYGIDMSTLDELFAPRFVPLRYNGIPKQEMLEAMRADLGVDSLRYLPVPELGSCIGCQSNTLCLGCVTGKYPTAWGNKLARIAKQNFQKGVSGRTYE